MPGKSHGWRRVVGYSPWAWKGSDRTEPLHFTYKTDKQQGATVQHKNVYSITCNKSKWKRIWKRRKKSQEVHNHKRMRLPFLSYSELHAMWEKRVPIPWSWCWKTKQKSMGVLWELWGQRLDTARWALDLLPLPKHSLIQHQLCTRPQNGWDKAKQLEQRVPTNSASSSYQWEKGKSNAR